MNGFSEVFGTFSEQVGKIKSVDSHRWKKNVRANILDMFESLTTKIKQIRNE